MAASLLPCIPSPSPRSCFPLSWVVNPPLLVPPLLLKESMCLPEVLFDPSLYKHRQCLLRVYIDLRWAVRVFPGSTMPLSLADQLTCWSLTFPGLSVPPWLLLDFTYPFCPHPLILIFINDIYTPPEEAEAFVILVCIMGWNVCYRRILFLFYLKTVVFPIIKWMNWKTEV